MSSLLVMVEKIEKIIPHPNADRLEIAKVKGWTVVTGKGTFKDGEEVIYIPIDSCLTDELAEQYGVKNYLGSQNKVKATRLRGIMSYGFIVKNDRNFKLGENVAEVLNITKYEPPIKITAGDAESPHEKFFKYTDIENIKNFPDVFKEGEEVVATEKIHGTNCRIGLIKTDDEYTYMVGSHAVRRKLGNNSLYERPLESLKLFLEYISRNNNDADVIVYCEIYGTQDLKYGLKNKGTDYRIFDIMINGVYQDYDIVNKYINDAYSNEILNSNVQLVPLLYRGPFNMDKMLELATGKTTLEADHIREGIVIKPTKETSNLYVGRKILKMINDDYLLRRKGTEYR